MVSIYGIAVLCIVNPELFVFHFISLFVMADEKILALAGASGKIRILSWENEKELVKFSADGASNLSFLTFVGKH